MDTAAMDHAREELMKENSIFRDLVHQHQGYEDRLDELAHLHYPSDDEQQEESVLKKKKLAVKDEIYSMLQQHSEKSNTGH